MTEEEILKEISTRNEVHVPGRPELTVVSGWVVSPEKLAVFLAKHLPHAPEVKEK